MTNGNDPSGPPQPEPDSPEMDRFVRGLEAYQKSDQAGNLEQTEAAAMEMFAAATEHAEKHPTPQMTLKLEAVECEGRGDWAGAEASYRKILALEEEAGNLAAIAKAHYDLSSLFLLAGDLDNADTSARAAVSAARRSGPFPLSVMVLEQQAGCALARSDHAAALAAASEAVAAVEEGPLYDFMRASTWLLRARCRMAAGDWAGGASDLAASQPILLGRELLSIAAGSHSRAARWWELTALARAHESGLQEASQAWARAVQIRRYVASLSHVAGPYTLAALARSLHGLYEALETAGKPEDSKAARAEARRIWSELGLQEQPWR